MSVDFAQLGGWDEQHPDRIPFAMSQPTLSQAAPGLYSAPLPDSVLLYKAWVDVLGKFPDYPAQLIGDCTSFGSAHTVDLMQVIRIAVQKLNEEFHETCTEAIYGLGREYANMLGSNGDGCYGGAVSKAVAFGTIDRSTVGAYSGQRAKDWGYHGVPADVKAKLPNHKVGAYALIANTDDAAASLANGNPFIVCSNQGFTMTRDKDGICYPHGSWGHCMSCSGYRTRGGKRQFCIDQSWGSDQPSGPLSDGQPPFSFWIEDAVLGRMLAQQDSWAFSSYAGWPGQELPRHWTVGGFA